MALVTVAALTALVVLVSLALTGILCVSSSHYDTSADALHARVRELAPYFAVTGMFFLLKRITHEPSVAVQKAIGWNITDLLYRTEGMFVARLQAVVFDPLIPVFSAFYMFGFPYVLIAPLVLYLLTDQLRTLKALLLAYMLNYIVGQICYTLFVAYGPRVHLPEVQGLMYEMFPQTQDMTSAISSNTDVFPSLHTSLAVVVLLFAWRTRHAQPRWFYISSVVVGGVVLSTMALGIHWLVDVLAGLVLAVWSVYMALRLVSLAEGDTVDVSRRGSAGEGTESSGFSGD